MTVLNCDVKNCYFNKSSKCCKDGIQIGGTDATIMDATYCEDFRELTVWQIQLSIVTAVRKQKWT